MTELEMQIKSLWHTVEYYEKAASIVREQIDDLERKNQPPKLLIEFTASQSKAVELMLNSVEFGGALFGQAWRDGIAVRVVNAKDAEKIANALGTKDAKPCGSANECFERE